MGRNISLAAASEEDVEKIGLAAPTGDGSILRIALAAILAIFLLAWYGNADVAPEDLALRKEDSHTRESLKGHHFTASSVPELRQMLNDLFFAKRESIVWFGNSQLHTINQMRTGDHLAPYWLFATLHDDAPIIPFGISLPNANLQEHFVEAEYVFSKVHPRLVMIGLCFDDLREDDLRDDFREILDRKVRAQLGQSSIGLDILARFDKAQSQASGDNADVGLHGFLQQPLEDRLTRWLARSWPLWAKRPALRAHLMNDLYEFRNAALRIKPTSVRKLIPLRYQRNMAALRELLVSARARGIPVLAYITPLRPDIAPPYDRQEYESWKHVTELLVKANGGSFVNLENIVPGPLWGTYHGDDVDFMHFQGDGHRILASELRPRVVQLTTQ